MNTKLEEINNSKYESIETRMTELKVQIDIYYVYIIINKVIDR